jgi:uncharacterized surface protein with fasciclin (FAS1) repeats
MHNKQGFLTFSEFRCWRKHLPDIQKSAPIGILILWMILIVCIPSCKIDPYESKWIKEESYSISQYVEKHREEYSKFYRLMAEAKMLNTLYAYNPYGDDYTLFLPTNEAIEKFIQQNKDYNSFEELLSDTGFIKKITRYHTINSKLHTDEFPDGALIPTTLTGDRLVTGFYTEGNNQLIKVNNFARIIKPNQKMTNGFIHVISEVLQKTEISGYNWLQQQEGFSILAEAIRLSGIRTRLWWQKYTILAEHDSIYHRNGIRNIEDLKSRIATPGMSLSNVNNTFYLFTSYHFVGGEYYLNDFSWGNRKYQTLANKLLPINIGVEVKINQGIDTYGYKVSGNGDPVVIDYIRPVWENSNIMTITGAIHSISDLMHYEPFPRK